MYSCKNHANKKAPQNKALLIPNGYLKKQSHGKSVASRSGRERKKILGLLDVLIEALYQEISDDTVHIQTPCF